MTDFIVPQVNRGRIANARTKDYVEFHLNPETIKIKTGSNFANDPIPGFSAPLRRWLSGKGFGFHFKLNLDGQMSVRRFGVVLENGVNPAPGQPFSVQGFIDWFLSFNYPTDPLQDAGGDGAADLAVFTFGTLANGILCDMEVAEVEILEFNPELGPTRAVLEVALTKKVYENETYGGVWRFDR